MVGMVITKIMQILGLEASSGPASTENAPTGTASTEDAASSATAASSAAGSQQKEPDQADELKRHLEERQSLERQSELAALTLVVLLVLHIEYTPVVVADVHLEEQYGDQARSLIHVEGFVTRLNELVFDGEPTWEERVSDHVETAMRRIDELDAYDQLLRSGQDSAVGRPPFLQTCLDRDPAVADWIKTAEALESSWPRVVERCIVELIGADFEGHERNQLLAPLVAANTDVTTAVARARREFPEVTPTATVTATATATATATVAAQSIQATMTPTAEPVERVAQKAFDEIEATVYQSVRAVRAGPEEAVRPLPADWLILFTGPDGSLRSFRDNMLLAYAGGGAETTRRSTGSVTGNVVLPRPVTPIPLISIQPLQVSGTGAAGLKSALYAVHASQDALQTRIDERTADLDKALPQFLAPVLVIAKPKHLVLIFPLAVAVVGGYLLLMYKRLQRNARRLKGAGATELPLLFFLGLVLAPLALLLVLFPAYNWPQFNQSWWQWTHWGSLALFLIVVLWCVEFKRASAPD